MATNSVAYATGYIGLLIVFVFFLGFGLIPAAIAKKKGYSFVLWWLFGCFFFLIALILSIVLTDKKAEKKAMSSSDADALSKYKELLDAGAITQEEFDQKKKQLLGI